MSPWRKTHRFRPCSNVNLTSQRPLFDQPNLYWRRPPSITNLVRPLTTNCRPTTTSNNLHSDLSTTKQSYLTSSSVYDRPATTYWQPTTTSNDLHSDLSTTKQTYPGVVLWPWSTFHDLLSTYYNFLSTYYSFLLT